MLFFLIRKLYGRSTEQTPPLGIEGQMSLLNAGTAEKKEMNIWDIPNALSCHPIFLCILIYNSLELAVFISTLLYNGYGNLITWYLFFGGTSCYC